MGRGLWGVARSRSLSTPGSVFSLSDSGNSGRSLLRAEADETHARKHRSEGRLEDVLDLAGIGRSTGIFETD